ncbi:MAG: hypothetical protein OXE86_10570 [Alphaproteobacteria bacterium]|nr:hypothetical protein [Alphaproteobacteria bacterium]
MPAGVIRTGGILAFAMVLIVLFLGLLVAIMAFGSLSGSPGALDDVRSMLVLMYVVCVPIGAFVAWTTKALFDASGYRGAGPPVVVLVLLLVINLIHLLDSGFHPTVVDMWEMGLVTFYGILSEVGPPLAVLSWMWLSVRITGFGRRSGSRLWQTTGVIYLVGMALLAAAMVSMSLGDNLRPIGLVTYAVPVLLVGWVCHAVGLIVGARRLTRARSQASAPCVSTTS